MVVRAAAVASHTAVVRPPRGHGHAAPRARRRQGGTPEVPSRARGRDPKARIAVDLELGTFPAREGEMGKRSSEHLPEARRGHVNLECSDEFSRRNFAQRDWTNDRAGREGLADLSLWPRLVGQLA